MSPSTANHLSGALMLRRSFPIVVVLVVAATLFPARADAGTVWRIGTKTSANPPTYPWPVAGSSGAYTRSFRTWDNACSDDDGTSSLESEVYVAYSGDKVYVTDLCPDGRSAVARIQNDSGTSKWICRNKSGNNTVAVCDFDWPESRGKVIIAGSYNGTTGATHWDDGSSVIVGASM